MQKSIVWLVVALLLGAGVCWGQTSPIFVAQINLLNQTEGIVKTALVTQNFSALCRITVYATTTPTGQQNDGWNVVFSWTDETGQKSTTSPLDTSSPLITGTFPVRV